MVEDHPDRLRIRGGVPELDDGALRREARRVDPAVHPPHQRRRRHVLRAQVVEEPLDGPAARAVDDTLQSRPAGVRWYSLPRPVADGHVSRTPFFSRCRSRCTSRDREIPGIPLAMSLNRVFPRTSSRMMSGFHRSAMISLAIATGQ